MKKQTIKAGMVISLVLLAVVLSSGNALAFGSATVSWTRPTTDDGGGALTGLTGYKIYYGTSSFGACSLGSATPININDATTTGGTTSYHFPNNLTPSQTYYFTVVATDGTNLSSCATGTGGVTEVSKVVSYTGDVETAGSSFHAVDMADYNLVKINFSTNNPAGDANKDGVVDMQDYNFVKMDFGYKF